MNAVTTSPFTAVVLAAGEGTRMRSRRAKVLHDVAGRSMLAHVVAAATAAGADSIAVVVGPGRDDVAKEAVKTAAGAASFVQTDRLGTAHAVLAARAALGAKQDVVVLFGDTPLVQPETIGRLRACLSGGTAVAVLGFEAADPIGYGRLIQDDEGAITTCGSIVTSAAISVSHEKKVLAGSCRVTPLRICMLRSRCWITCSAPASCTRSLTPRTSCSGAVV